MHLKLLNARTRRYFRRVEVPLRIGRQVVEALEISGSIATIPKPSDDVECPAVDDHDLSVVEIGDVHEALLGVW